MKSYKDLLDPKRKGKIVMDDPTSAGLGLKWFGVVGKRSQRIPQMYGFHHPRPFLN